MGMFIVGLDNDTPESLERLSEFVLSANFHQVDFSILTPIPGTRIYTQLTEEQRILSKDWSKYTWQNVNYKPKHFTPKELQGWVNKLLQNFYAPKELQKRRVFFKELLRTKQREENHE
jgi:radical SAM superfamily enzyme YgiQ (UPF0313 family)